jgi:16S rRNA (cytidine1402-2'-O)-methyltransferase
VLYEAPARVAATLEDLAAALGQTRRGAVARELTKIHEEFVRGSLEELALRYAVAAPRGEVTLIVEGAAPDASEEPVDLAAAVRAALAEGRSPKEIAAELALRTGKPRRAIYQLAIALKR